MRHIPLYQALQSYDLILASNSPRRKELLTQMQLNFRVLALQDIDETYPSSLLVDEVAKHIVEKKVAAYREWIGDNTLLVAADTVVCWENQVLGKPQNDTEARNMLRTLSGREHRVITAVALASKTRTLLRSVQTKVKFVTLTETEIEDYLQVYQPYDKAGSYGIQEWIGLIGIESIEGSYYNVMGLPTHELYRLLHEMIECK